MTGSGVASVQAEGAAASCELWEKRLEEPGDTVWNAMPIGRCGVVDLPPILPFDHPPTVVPNGLFPLAWPGFADRIAAMSDAPRDTPRNDSRLAATWDWCVLFVRTVAAPQAVFWYLTWNLVKPRPRRSRNA